MYTERFAVVELPVKPGGVGGGAGEIGKNRPRDDAPGRDGRPDWSRQQGKCAPLSSSNAPARHGALECERVIIRYVPRRPQRTQT